MQGLNDDVEDGLIALEDDTLETLESDSNINDEPTSNPNQPIPEKLLLETQEEVDMVADHKEVTITDLFGLGVVPNELPNLNAEFVIIKQKDNELTDLQTMTESIRSKQSISQEDVKALDSLSAGFLNEDTRLVSYFTKEPSQTQFNSTIREADIRIGTNSQEISNLFKTHLEKLTSSYATLESETNHGFTDLHSSQTKAIKDLLDTNWQRLTSLFNNYYFTNIFKLKDLFTKPISEINFNFITTNKELLETLNTIKEQTQNTQLKQYLTNFRFNSEGGLVNDVSIAYTENDLTIFEIINIYLGESQSKLPTEILKVINFNQNFLEGISIEYNLNENTKTFSEYLLNVDKLQTDLTFLSNLELNLIKFNESILKLIRILSFITK